MVRTSALRQLIHLFQNARRVNLAVGHEAPPVTYSGPRISRRGLLKTGLIGAAALVSGTFGCTGPQPDQPGDNGGAPRIAIVGGGLAGLSAAYRLRQAGLNATVYEARARLGGRVASVNGLVADGLVSDLGGKFINSDHADMLALIEIFGLELFDRRGEAEAQAMPTTAYFFNGRAYREAEVAQLLAPLAARITADADALDDDFKTTAKVLDALSVSAYLDLHADAIPAPFIRRLIEQSIRTEYGVEPDASSALQLIYLLPTVDGKRMELFGTNDEQYTLQGGSQSLVDALVAALGDQIRTNQRLTRLEQNGATFNLFFNGISSITADYIILTVPFPVLRNIPLEVDLPDLLKRFINEVNLGRNEKLFAGFSSRPWREAGVFSLDAWSDLGNATLWDGSQRQHERREAELTFFFGGEQTQINGDAESRGRILLDALDPLIPNLSSAATGRFTQTGWGADEFTGGTYSSYAPGQYLEFAEYFWIEGETPQATQAVYVNNLIFAGEHLSDAYYGYMNGAVETGRLAAQLVAQRIAAT